MYGESCPVPANRDTDLVEMFSLDMCGEMSLNVLIYFRVVANRKILKGGTNCSMHLKSLERLLVK